MTSKITLALTLVAACGIAACTSHKEYPDVSYKTCPFAGIENVDKAECVAFENTYNIDPSIGQKTDMNKVDNQKHMHHGKVHYRCQHGGTNPHVHHGKIHHSSCYSK